MEKFDITEYMLQLSNLHLRELQLILYGHDPVNSVYERYKFGRGTCGIIIAIDGAAEYTFANGDRLILSKGELVFFSAESKYILKTISPQGFPHYTVNFSLEAGEKLPLDRLVIRPTNFHYFVTLFENLLKTHEHYTATSKFKEMSLLNHLVAEFLESALESDTTGCFYTKILPAINHINENYNQKITIDKLCRLCMMSSSHFRRVFTQIYHMSPIEYLMRIRIQRATELIIESNLPVSAIAEKCGFKDEEYFCRVLKKRTGKTVRQMRKPMDVISKQTGV